MPHVEQKFGTPYLGSSIWVRQANIRVPTQALALSRASATLSVLPFPEKGRWERGQQGLVIPTTDHKDAS